MLETERHHSERSRHEDSYRSHVSSSSPHNSSVPQNSTSTSISTHLATSSHLPFGTSFRTLPQRESSPRPSDDTQSYSRLLQSPRLQPSRDDPVAELPAVGRPASPSAPAATSLADSTPQSSPSISSGSSAISESPRIQIKDLRHIQSFLDDESSSLGFSRSTSAGSETENRQRQPHYEISSMPITDVIEMVAGLLTKITTTNDRQHEHLHRHITTPDRAAGLSQQTSSVLAFHGKNVPSISILSYLSRIHKYCPTTYEVFISLLVYFDRMTEKVNSGPIQGMRQARQQSVEQLAGRDHVSPQLDGGKRNSHGFADTPPSSFQNTHQGRPDVPSVQEPLSPPLSDSDPYNLSHFFVVDSFNIHRLVIATVTCASKYFSDVFYTNSRYAKVGGLPLVELNHLEMQFLLLNDFRLAISVEELEAYATMLVEFYAREVAAQRSGGGGGSRGDSMEGVEASP